MKLVIGVLCLVLGALGADACTGMYADNPVTFPTGRINVFNCNFGEVG